MSPLADLLSDLQQLEKAAAARHGALILDAFTRHTPFRDGAVWLRDGREAHLRLAAQSGSCTAPEQVARIDEISLEVVLPLGARDPLGILGFAGMHSEEDLRLAHVAAGYLAMLMTNQRLASEMREGDFQLKYRLWELESLYDIGLSIASTLNIDELADEVLARMISLLNVRRAALFLRDGDRFPLYRSFGDAPQLTDADYRRLVATGEAIRHEEGTVVALPIAGNNAIIGVLAAAERETRDGGIGSFDANDLRLLSLFASQVAIALENARLHKEALEKQAMQREMELAATIQANILPKSIPEIEGFEIASLSIPARQVGGDYHAFFEHDGIASMLVADVAGKSMPAALLVSAFHAAVQLLMEEGRELGEIATELNKHIHRWSAENKFVTMLMVSIDREHELLRYVNAGHNPGYVLTGGNFELLKSHGLPIGIMPHSRYMTQTRPFPAGSTVVIYSDGITEAENVAGDEFDNARLETVLRADPAASPSSLRERIAAAVVEFVGEAPQKDDQTLVIARSAR